MTVAMEPTGTYGDPLRQSLQESGIIPHRVSPKAASDYAEVFDGVPSQHDGKDAAVIAELTSQERCWPWAYQPADESAQELGYWVDRLDSERRQMVWSTGRLEALLARHWPEATRVLKLSSGTLLRCLGHYGGPEGLASDPDGVEQLCGWGRGFLKRAKAERLREGAAETVGVRQGRWDQRRVCDAAEAILSHRAEHRRGRRRLQELGKANKVIAAQAEVVGVVTASVLWHYLGDPRAYSSGAAYRKAMGLNLAERSSGRYQGKLKISKRGSAQVRRWMYLASLRWVKKEPVHSWYVEQKRSRRGEGKGALVAVMRKLAMALYQVGCGQPFYQARLFHQLSALTQQAQGSK
jgi:transposase